jgi:hypothetical protein
MMIMKGMAIMAMMVMMMRETVDSRSRRVLDRQV